MPSVTWMYRIRSCLMRSTMPGLYRRPIRPSSLCRTSLTSASFALLPITRHSVKCVSPSCTPTTGRWTSLRRPPLPCVCLARSHSTWQTLTSSRKTRTWPRTWRERIVKTARTAVLSLDLRFADVSVGLRTSNLARSETHHHVSVRRLPIAIRLPFCLSSCSGWPMWCSPVFQWWDLQSYWADWLLMCVWRKLGWSNMWWWGPAFHTVSVIAMVCPHWF